MNTIVFNQGFNRVEHHQIICLERAKLNRLLDEERRITEMLARSIKRQFETAPNILLAEVQKVWNNIQNHSRVLVVRERIVLLTDAYPQFLRQVETVRDEIKRKILGILQAFGTENQFLRQSAVALPSVAGIR